MRKEGAIHGIPRSRIVRRQAAAPLSVKKPAIYWRAFKINMPEIPMALDYGMNGRYREHE